MGSSTKLSEPPVPVFVNEVSVAALNVLNPETSTAASMC